MKSTKDPKTGKWLIQYRYVDWTGQRHKTTKRGFDTKKEADEWLRDFQVQQKRSMNIKFADFVQIYLEDKSHRLKAYTMHNKTYIINSKLIPYFGTKKMNEITVAEIRKWQNELIGQGYTPTYLKTINNNLNAIFNYAVDYYELPVNPCRKAGSMGKNKADEMNIWTLEEYRKFIDCCMDDRVVWLACQILFWTGVRIGELMALTFADVDLNTGMMTISKSLQRLNGKDLITPPKTPKSNRKIKIPQFLVQNIQDYWESLYEPHPEDRIIPIKKGSIQRGIDQGVKRSGVKKIRIHDFRHSHASLLMNMRVPIKEISERLGHENIETTLNTYAHLYPDDQDKLAQQLDQKYLQEVDDKR